MVNRNARVLLTKTKDRSSELLINQLMEIEEDMKTRVFGGILMLGTLIACGGGSSPSTPSIPTPPPFPQVAGNYSGTVNVIRPELGESFNCPVTTSVTQAGSLINVHPLAASGACGALTLTVGETTMSQSGTWNMAGTIRDTCGFYSFTMNGSFVGRELRINTNATSNTCWNFNFNAVMTR